MTSSTNTFLYVNMTDFSYLQGISQSVAIIEGSFLQCRVVGLNLKPGGCKSNFVSTQSPRVL